MSIVHHTLINKVVLEPNGGANQVALINSLKSYWELGEAHEGNTNLLDLYYNNEEYLRLSFYANSTSSNAIEVTAVTKSGSYLIYKNTSMGSIKAVSTVSIVNTPNGVALLLHSGRDDESVNVRSYNIFLAKDEGGNYSVINTDGTNVSICSRLGKSDEGALASLINANKKAYYVPLVDTTNSIIYQDLLWMRVSPSNCNMIQVSDADIFLCGSNLCMRT